MQTRSLCPPGPLASLWIRPVSLATWPQRAACFAPGRLVPKSQGRPPLAELRLTHRRGREGVGKKVDQQGLFPEGGRGCRASRWGAPTANASGTAGLREDAFRGDCEAPWGVGVAGCVNG